MLGMGGVGTGVGPIIARHFTGDRDRPLRSAIILGYLMGAAGLAIVAPMVHFGWVLLGVTLRGIGGGIVWVFSTQLLLHLTPQSCARTRLFHRLRPFHADECCRFCSCWRGTRRFTEHPQYFLVDGGFDIDSSRCCGRCGCAIE